jgi:hypothetical protein
VGWQQRVLAGDKSALPGMVRMSVGCYNDEADIDRLLDMLHRVARGRYSGDYRVDPATGDFLPAGYSEPIAAYFDWGAIGR